MAILQTKKQSDLEKRLKLLRQQVYGKENVSSIPPKARLAKGGKYQVSREEKQESADITYLYQDLLKIVVLVTIALGAQLTLFYLLKNQVLSLNFF